VSALPVGAVGSGRLQDALARVLAQPHLLDQLCFGQPADTAAGLRQFGLTSSDAATLAAIDPAALRRFRADLQLKRARMAKSLMPVTTAQLVALSSMDSLASGFWAAFPPVRGNAEVEDFRESAIRDFRDFVLGLPPAGRPEWLPDLARYEAMRALLRCRAPGGQPAGPDAIAALTRPATVVSLARGVDLGAFGYDVVTLLPYLAQSGTAPADLQPEQCLVVTVRPPGAGVRAWRLGPLAFRLLQACATGRQVGDLAATPAACRPDGTGGQAAGIIRQALQAGILCINQAVPAESTAQ
jgi:hypothetical protein